MVAKFILITSDQQFTPFHLVVNSLVCICSCITVQDFVCDSFLSNRILYCCKLECVTHYVLKCSIFTHFNKSLINRPPDLCAFMTQILFSPVATHGHFASIYIYIYISIYRDALFDTQGVE